MRSNVREMSSFKQGAVNSVNDVTDNGDACRDQLRHLRFSLSSA